MRIYIVEGGKLVAYERTGQCNHCGECCCTKTINFTTTTRNYVKDAEDTGGEDEDWSEWEGYSILLAHGTWWYFRINSITDKDAPCPALRDGNVCSEWMDPEQFRPICRYWPFNPHDLEQFPKCGFRFGVVAE